jgi:hypothetical protein
MEKSTSSVASATEDCKRSIELAAVMAQASRALFHVQRFGFSFGLGLFVLRFWRRDDAGKADVE